MRIATCYANGRAVLSHLSALAVWGVREPLLPGDERTATVVKAMAARWTLPRRIAQAADRAQVRDQISAILRAKR